MSRLTGAVVVAWTEGIRRAHSGARRGNVRGEVSASGRAGTGFARKRRPSSILEPDTSGTHVYRE